MSNAVFPSLPGLKWDVTKSPRWSTKVQRAAGGKEVRAAFWTRALYTWQLSYELLRANALLELQSLVSFFNARQGKFDSFLFTDPNDNAVVNMGFGQTDGVTTSFQLQRAIPGFYAPDQWEGSFSIPNTARFNQLIRTTDLTNAAWSKETGVTVTANQSIDPDGGLVSDSVLTSIPNHGVFQTTSVAASAGTQYVFSVWIRSDTPTFGTISVNRTGGFDQTDQAITVDTQWRRFLVKSAIAWTGTTAIVVIVRPGEGHPFFVYAPQLELGATPTPYMPNAGGSAPSAGSVTFWPANQLFEPVFDLNYVAAPPPSIFVNGVLKACPADYTIGPTGIVTFGSAPGGGAALTWSGSYYWRVRFDLDEAEFNNFLYQLWEAKKVTLVSVK